jgi:SAM-dependent methyltransferase
MSGQPWTVRRIAGGIGRRLPVRPLRPLFPYVVWRPLFRLWLHAIRVQGDRQKAMRQLLEVYQDAYYGVDFGAIDYDDGIHAKHRLTRYHDFFVERVRAGERVLDVGCGKGELAYDIAERAGATVLAVDASPWMLKFARERFSHPRVSYIQADAVEFTPEEQVDVAILSNVLEHIGARVDLLRALRDRAGASRLLIRVPVLDRDWIVPLRRELGLEHFSDPEHKIEYDAERLRSELGEAGWEMGEPRFVWGVSLPPIWRRDSNAGLVLNELNGATAGRIDHWEAAGHRLDHHARARIFHLRVQEDVSAAKDGRRVTLRVAPDKLHSSAQA